MYRVCQDPDSRLAVSQGLARQPDCRDELASLIDINKKYKVSVTAGDRVELPAVSVSLDKLTSP